MQRGPVTGHHIVVRYPSIRPYLHQGQTPAPRDEQQNDDGTQSE